jgi:hypothetical protein
LNTHRDDALQTDYIRAARLFSDNPLKGIMFPD